MAVYYWPASIHQLRLENNKNVLGALQHTNSTNDDNNNSGSTQARTKRANKDTGWGISQGDGLI